MKYRPEVDGLRALAVLPVILFHGHIQPFTGGYVGVDVFFVISGYLITSIILADQRTGTFSLLSFYERRARRILPALFVVMAACLPFAWAWLQPDHMKAFARSVAAVAAFSSNFLFWRESGYFDTTVDLKPLLHTWSLAVEEQYYVLFPPLLLLLLRLPRRAVVATLGGVAALSLLAAHWGAFHRPAATFFLLPMRAWELLMGSLLAFHLANAPEREWSPRLANAGALAGVALLAYAVLAFDNDTPFPSLYALVPTLGAVLIILFATRETVVGRTLASKPFVGLGLISYSAYLWHQPLFAFARLRSLTDPPPAVFAVLAVAALALAYLSWRFVERPFRDRRGISRQAVFSMGLVGSAAFICAGIVGNLANGFQSREKWQQIADTFLIKQQRSRGNDFCEQNAVPSRLGATVCVIGDTARQPEGVLWGDSFAAALLPAFHDDLRREGRAFYAVLGEGCIPIDGIYRTVRHEFACTPDRNARVVEHVVGAEALRRVVWVGAFGAIAGGAVRDYVFRDGQATPERVRESMLRTVGKLKRAGKQVVLVGDPPRFPHPAADYEIAMYARGADLLAREQRVRRADLERSNGVLPSVLRDAQRDARVVDGLDVFCTNGDCLTHDAAGRLLFGDATHLSAHGAMLLSRRIIEALDFSNRPLRHP